ncbi:Na+/H+ antiporter subunit E [Pseudomonas sp. 9Ag]|jgi:multicomponent Na+:H+ antiporter subunit E|uniref:Na+/H+ antiporter subunit E n=1 Tax=Pseudomonas sp. 9Ag TaxID=2653167 RepID=UPI0012F24A07|nr:Na+/H+ antiporter subunit E [Pseudomonas sp. 9Ag]VXD00177.1 Sodium:proton antiporter [Pseudomonas sp. 9Ag]
MGELGGQRRWLDGLGWVALYALVWALFTEGAGWILGVPSILLAAGLSLWLGQRPWHPSLAALPGFLGFFLGKMAAGAWDVALRALHPNRPLQPAWLDYSLTSSSSQVRLVLSALVGLLPGTLASQVEGDRMRVHVLDERQPWEATVHSLERRLERLLAPGDRP